MFTVLIPTFNRPDLLRNSLLSVSQQTEVASIDCVIVSENGLNRGSEAVCLEFADSINIKYFFHEQQLPISAHLQWVLSRVEQGYGAMLCDDDWWDIHHLALAKESLLLNEKCVAYFGNHAYSRGITSMKNVYSEWTKSMHFGKENFLNFKPIVYDKYQLFPLCCLITPFHFSAMVCEGKVLRKAVKVFSETHPTYYDRILFPLISTYGKVIYNPLATAIILFHPGMDGNTYSPQDWKIERQNGSLKIMSLGKTHGVNTEQALNNIYTKNAPDDASFVYEEIKAIFFNRNNLVWFAGYSRIQNEDLKVNFLQKSVRNKIKIKIRSLAALLYNKM